MLRSVVETLSRLVCGEARFKLAEAPTDDVCGVVGTAGGLGDVLEGEEGEYGGPCGTGF